MTRAGLSGARRPVGAGLGAAWLLIAIATYRVQPARAQSAPEAATNDTQASQIHNPQVAPPGLGLSRWINPATAPFIPVPVIGADPNSGTTLGILPTWVHTNEQGEISRIIAPDFTHNPDFGYGAHGRIFSYPSENEQWSVVAGLQERVQKVFDAEYATELSRQNAWSINYSAVFNRDGTPRFFGIGNSTRLSDESNFTRSREFAQIQVGFNFSHEWQLLYTFRPERVDVTPGTLQSTPTIASRFPDVLGLGVNELLLNRLSVVYDTRDNLIVPREGVQWVLYGGLASRSGIFNDSEYSEAGIDARSFWPLNSNTVLAAHASLRYLPSTNRIPFWALSNIGGDADVIGGEQALRGFGEGRFYDRDAFTSTLELRRKVLSFQAATTRVDVEFTPFIELGRVFAQASTLPFTQLHKVAGIGFRGVARPFIVGYVDFGYGGEGLAAFTGINYPF